MEENKNLAICIPTYNRGAALQRSLSLWFEKVKPYNIPIYISDNASDDNTREVVESFCAVYPYIHYIRNDSNIGPDKNFEQVLKLPDTDYRWLMGDDDFLDNGNIGQILDSMKKNKYGAIILSAKCGKLLVNSQEYCDKNKLMQDLGSVCTYMSLLIFSKEYVNSETFDEVYSSEYANLNFAHTAALFSCAAKFNYPILYCDSIKISGIPGGGPLRWVAVSFHYFCNNLSVTSKMLPDFYTEYSKRLLVKKIKTVCWGFKHYLYYAFMARIVGNFNLRYFLTHHGQIANIFSIWERCILFVLAFTPRALLAKLRERRNNRKKSKETGLKK